MTMTTYFTATLSVLFVVFLLQCTTMVKGHGRLAIPSPRYVESPYLNLPINKPWASDEVCKDLPAASPNITLIAGENITVQWQNTANHVGDCFMYLSYDGVYWFKIVQWAQCNLMNFLSHNLTIPSYLPSCDACIMRYEWYALHIWPQIELYVDCVDVKIVGVPNGQLPTPQVFIPGHLPLTGGNSTNPLYRNAFDPSIPFFFTGPPVATLADSQTSSSVTPPSTGHTTASPASSTATSARSSTAARLSTATTRLASSSTGHSAAAAATSTGGSSSTPHSSTASSSPQSSPSSTASSSSTTNALSSTGAPSTNPLPAPPLSVAIIIIMQTYRTSWSQYSANAATYRNAFVHSLATTSRPPLDAASLSVVLVTRNGNTGIRVVFAYDPSELPSAADVEAAIAAATPDNSTNTDAVQIEPDGTASVLLSMDGWTGSTGDVGGTSISASGVDDTSASSSAMAHATRLTASASTRSPLVVVTTVVTGTLVMWLSGALQ